MLEKIINRNNSDEGHVWEKQNLMTITSRKGGYDIYKCKNCETVKCSSCSKFIQQ